MKSSDGPSRAGALHGPRAGQGLRDTDRGPPLTDGASYDSPSLPSARTNVRTPLGLVERIVSFARSPPLPGSSHGTRDGHSPPHRYGALSVEQGPSFSSPRGGGGGLAGQLRSSNLRSSRTPPFTLKLFRALSVDGERPSPLMGGGGGSPHKAASVFRPQLFEPIFLSYRQS